MCMCLSFIHICLCKYFPTDVEEEEQGNDWLFTVIDDIVSAHNLVIESLYSFVAVKKLDMLARLFPDEPAKMYPSEMDDTNCLVGEFSRYSIS